MRGPTAVGDLFDRVGMSDARGVGIGAAIALRRTTARVVIVAEVGKCIVEMGDRWLQLDGGEFAEKILLNVSNQCVEAVVCCRFIMQVMRTLSGILGRWWGCSAHLW